ncbi:BGTF surface domain-containing protein [Haladaptatus sp. NG-WS-4]
MAEKITKVRSLVLTALMVMSVFAGATAFAGSAVAASDYDTTIENSSVVYKGQVGLVDQYSADTKVTLSKGKDGGDGFVDTYTADGDGEFTIDTTELETGFYQLSAGSTTITFQVVEQSFDVSADLTSIMENSNDQSVTFSIDDSNREDLNVSVYSEEITDDENAIDSYSGMYEEGDGTHEFTVDFSSYDLEPGTYNVTVSVDDTSASKTFEVTVQEGGSALSIFDDSVYTVPRGDIVPMTVNLENTDTAKVSIGADEANFKMSVDVTDKDDDGKVTFWLNTYKSTSGDASQVIYTASDSNDEVSASWVTPSNDGLGHPLAVTSGDNIYELSVDTDDDGNPDDVGSLSVEPRQTGSAQTWIAPSNLGANKPSDLTDEITQRSNAAYQDYVVVQVKDTTGVYGALNNPTENDLSNVDGLSFTVKEDNPEPNTDADSFDSTNTGVSMIDDGANNSLYFVIETDAIVGVDEEDMQGDWTATFSVDKNYNVSVDKKESVSSSFTVEERTLDLNDGNNLEVAPSDNQSISGTTNLAPGSSVTLQARSSGVFFKNQEVTVSEDGSYSAMFDFSEYDNGNEFSVTATASGADAVSVDGVLNQDANQQTTTTTTTTMTTTTTSDVTSTTTSDVTSTTTEDTTTTETTNEEGQPGFGVAVSIVALLAAALLALRREN